MSDREAESEFRPLIADFVNYLDDDYGDEEEDEDDEYNNDLEALKA